MKFVEHEQVSVLKHGFSKNRSTISSMIVMMDIIIRLLRDVIWLDEHLNGSDISRHSDLT